MSTTAATPTAHASATVPGSAYGDSIVEAAQGDIEEQLLTILTRVKRAMAGRARGIHPELQGAGYAILLHLVNQDAVRASDLVATLDLDKGFVSRQVGHLERLGLVERVSDPDDGRAQRITLTPAGRETLDRVRSEARADFERRLTGWTAEELTAFAAQLRRYNEGLAA